MATQTRTPTGFTSAAGTNPANSGTQLAAVQTAGDSLYVQVQNNGNAFYCTFTAFDIPADATVNFVRITPTVRGADANTCTCLTAQYVGTTTYASSAQNVATTTFTALNFDWATNPATSSAWTVSDVEALTRMYVQAPDASPDLWVDHVQITVDYTEAGSGVDVTPDNASHAHTASSPTLAQTHVLVAANAAHAHAATSPTVSQTVTVEPDDASHAHAATSPALTQTHVLTPASASHAHTATSPTVSQDVDVWPTALAEAVAGTGTARIGFFGDSYFEGVGASDRAHRWIDVLASGLRSTYGISGSALWHSGYWFDGPGGDTDPATTGAQSTSDDYLGRRGVVLDAGEYVEWPITGRYLDLFSSVGSGASLVLSVGGSTLATWTADGTTRRHDFGSAASRTVRVAATGATVGVHGILEYSTNPDAGLNYIESTRGGATSAYWQPGTGAVAAMEQAAPDLIVWSLYGNDFLPDAGDAAPSIVATRFDAFLDEVETWAKVPHVALLLYWGMSYEGPNTEGATHEDYRVALRTVANAHAAQIIDLSDVYDPVSTGWLIGDGVHPNDTGHAAIAGYVLDALPGPLGSATVVPADTTHGHTASSPALTQTHLLTAAGATHTHAATSPTLAQTHLLTAASGAHSHTATSPSLTQAIHIPPANGDRTMAVLFEDRTFRVRYEDRSLTVAHESRTLPCR